MRRTALTVAALALTTTALTGCGALDTAFDCVRTADAIATSVDRLSQAVGSAGDPTQIQESLDDIDRELDNLRDTTGNADLTQAVDDLSAGVDTVRTAVEKGDTTPDLTPITNAASEVAKVCTP
ncbi:hypothetical protein [Streptomyces sp. CC228A]|uniref:hypothetical protein n=1 Tax=Streptomyces sp. CC228A TaxID=2898186 RepID=UPI001F2F52D7|nr:hypothetical protein [Streptomyces sp. CC228A]